MEEITYPCIMEVSQSENFTQDPYAKKNKTQAVCIGKINNKYMCIKYDESQVEYLFNLLKHASMSGAISGITLEFWNYARTQKKKTFQDWLKVNT